MHHYFCNYHWKNGVPHGIGLKAQMRQDREISYKIVMDPYRKRISLEKYEGSQFSSLIYDSALLDFRHLKQGERIEWEREIVAESSHKMVCHIRNREERLLFVETHFLEQNQCQECHIHSAHGVLLAIQKMRYVTAGDPFNGVTLFDTNAHQVLEKHYDIHETTGLFTELRKESWVA
jgi:hypothetical protein